LRTNLVILLLLGLLGCSQPSAKPTLVSRQRLVDETVKPLAPERFAAISRQMNLGQILQILDPARGALGSGITILEWESTDGHKFTIGFAQLDMSSMPLGPGSFYQ
jgi:hypothetical protein